MDENKRDGEKDRTESEGGWQGVSESGECQTGLLFVWRETGATKRPSEPRLSGVHTEEAQWNKGAKLPRLRWERVVRMG